MARDLGPPDPGDHTPPDRGDRDERGCRGGGGEGDAGLVDMALVHQRPLTFTGLDGLPVVQRFVSILWGTHNPQNTVSKDGVILAPLDKLEERRERAAGVLSRPSTSSGGERTDLKARGNRQWLGAGAGLWIVRMVGPGGSAPCARMDLHAIQSPVLVAQSTNRYEKRLTIAGAACSM